MRIIELKINGYKQLQNFELNMSNKNTISESLNLTFLVGENGTGKSSFLEALSIIFTKTMVDLGVGFDFELEYHINNSFVKMTNKVDEKKQYEFKYYKKDKQKEYYPEGEEKKPFSEAKNLHPGRIFTLGSGPHNNFEDVVIKNPIQNLSENLIKSDANPNSKNNIAIYEDVLFNPKVLNFDSNSLIFILISMLYFSPESIKEISNSNEDQSNEQKFSLQRKVKFEENLKLLKDNVSLFTEEGFSFVVNNKEKNKLAEGVIKNTKIENKSFGKYPERFLNNLHSILTDLNPDLVKNNNKFHYFFNTKDLKNQNEKTSQNELTSLTVLTTLMIAYRIGIIEDARMYLKHGDKNILTTEQSFSDGEWFWLSKIGLTILIQTSIEDDFLVIYDEPDAFLNEGWIEDFIFSMDKFSKNHDEDGKLTIKSHDYFVATHSTLMLTDAMKNQVYKFTKNNKGIKCSEINFSTFGADRSFISSKLFLDNKRTGKFVDQKIDDAFANNDMELMDELLRELGQGYDRFLIQELRMQIKSKRQ